MKLDQRGTLIELQISLFLGLIFLALGIPNLQKHHWARGVLFTGLGLFLLGWLLWFVLIGPMLEGRRIKAAKKEGVAPDAGQDKKAEP